ncbi:MAG: hypothetical protein HDR12_17655 [Lachnospiraceae bacterium]|nr:hypothetical protein [Lachnospiraceae bacterium]
MTHIIGIIFWLLVIPFCIGLLPSNFISERKINPGVILLAGYMLMWAVFEVITIPAVIWIQNENFYFVLRWFLIISILLAIAGLFIWYMSWRKCKRRKVRFQFPYLASLKHGIEAKIEWLLFFAILGFQLYMSVTRVSFDGDDAYYVVHSVMAQQSGTMYKFLPYTGWTTSLDIRHALAVFPMWIAFVAVKADIHATIVSHVIMPLLLIPLSYLIYYEIAKVLFASRRENIPVFMIIMGMFQMFGNVSIYTNETFFLTRTWQGKAVVCSVIIPMMFLLLLWIFDKESGNREQSAGLWALLVCLNMATGICSSLAVFVLAILLALSALCMMVVERDWKIPLKMGLTCIPNAVYVLIYLYYHSIGG